MQIVLVEVLQNVDVGTPPALLVVACSHCLERHLQGNSLHWEGIQATWA